MFLPALLTSHRALCGDRGEMDTHLRRDLNHKRAPLYCPMARPRCSSSQGPQSTASSPAGVSDRGQSHPQGLALQKLQIHPHPGPRQGKPLLALLASWASTVLQQEVSAEAFCLNLVAIQVPMNPAPAVTPTPSPLPPLPSYRTAVWSSRTTHLPSYATFAQMSNSLPFPELTQSCSL